MEKTVGEDKNSDNISSYIKKKKKDIFSKTSKRIERNNWEKLVKK